jgi:hypothetical protein
MNGFEYNMMHFALNAEPWNFEILSLFIMDFAARPSPTLVFLHRLRYWPDIPFF